MLERILASPVRVMSPVNYWECLVRIRALFGEAGVTELKQLVSDLQIQVEPATADHATLAADAFARFGIGHPARLNLGDCFAYALSMSQSAPLVFKGNDFPRTDLPLA